MDIPQVIHKHDAETGDMGQQYLAAGKHVALRRWQEGVGGYSDERTRDYETVGYVIDGTLELELNGESAKLTTGDSWLVPAGAKHRYRIIKPLIAIEATSPPARFGARDDSVSKK